MASRLYEHVTEEELEKITKEIHSKKVLVAIYLAYHSGLRISEILNLDPEDIHLNIRQIFIRQGKGKKDRITLLPKRFKQEWKSLFPLKNFITKMGIQKSFKEASIRAKVNREIFSYETKSGKRKKYRLHFHSLRHSFAVNLLKKGVPLNAVKILMGHSYISTTEKYLHLSGEGALAMAIEKGL